MPERPSCNRAPLNRCATKGTRWKHKKHSVVIRGALRLPVSRSWADSFSGPRVSMAIGWKTNWVDILVYWGVLPVAVIAAAAPMHRRRNRPVYRTLSHSRCLPVSRDRPKVMMSRRLPSVRYRSVGLLIIKINNVIWQWAESPFVFTRSQHKRGSCVFWLWLWPRLFSLFENKELHLT